MRLSKIKLSGFKTFVEPTTLTLPSNLVGIVGPNGCGKSNIIDAYEERVEFYDDDISPLLGSIVLFFSIAVFLAGVVAFGMEFVYEEMIVESWAV